MTANDLISLLNFLKKLNRGRKKKNLFKPENEAIR